MTPSGRQKYSNPAPVTQYSDHVSFVDSGTKGSKRLTLYLKYLQGHAEYVGAVQTQKYKHYIRVYKDGAFWYAVIEYHQTGLTTGFSVSVDTYERALDYLKEEHVYA